MLSVLIILTLIASSFLIYHRQRPRIRRNGHRLKTPPDTWPLLGNAVKFLQPRHLLFDWFVECERRFAKETFEISVPSLPPGVVINDPANVEFVLRNEASITKGDFFKQRSWDLFGYGIINASGDLWKAQRKAGLKFFSGTNLEVMVDEVLPDVYEKTRMVLLKAAKDDSIVDMAKVFLDLTTAVVGQMAYDVALAEVKKFGRQIVTNAKRYRSQVVYNSLWNGEEPVLGSLIDSLIETFEQPEVIADSALNFLSAGRDTTAQSLTWSLYCLLRHPNAAELLRKEIATIRPDTNLGAESIGLSMANLQYASIPYTTAVFYESLRLYPPVPFELKQCDTDVTLPDGTFLPETSIVVWCIWAMNRSKSYGDDAESFRPGRWLDEDGKFTARSAFEFPVFNGGPRACLGKKMAETMVAYVLIVLLRDFDFEEVFDEAQGKMERVSRNSLTLPMEGGLPCKIRIRNSI